MVSVDKCVTFGIKKYSKKSLQFQPKLFCNLQTVPSVKDGESLKYLGRFFDFEMSNENHKTKLLSLFTSLLKEIDDLPLHSKNKLLLYHRYVLSKVSCHFTVADLSRTWVIENIDNPISKYIRLWLDLPISATLAGIDHSKDQFSLNLQLPSFKFTQCQTVSRNALNPSPNTNIQTLWKKTSNDMNLQYDIYPNTKEVLKAVKSDGKERLIHNLPSQGAIMFC